MPNVWKRWNYLIIKFMSVIRSVKEIKYEKIDEKIKEKESFRSVSVEAFLDVKRARGRGCFKFPSF